MNRILLTVLGASELLMAARSTPALTATGIAGGIALIAAAWIRTPNRGTRAGLVAVGTIPFAALGWTAVVPVLLAVAAAVVAVPGLRQNPTTEGILP